jgi:undecaprenyl-diphosphatase
VDANLKTRTVPAAKPAHGSFMKKHGATNSFLKLELVAGLIVFATMTLTLGEISEDVINHEPLAIADIRLSNWLHAHGAPFLTKAMLVATLFGSSALVTAITFAVGLYLLWRKRRYWLVALVCSVGGAALLNRLLKLIFHRARPHFDDPILRLDSYSFPSGHTMMATVLYGCLAAWLLVKITDWRWRALIVVAAGLLIGLVGFSRIYLGAHYLSDVLGAFAEGLAWLALCLTSVYAVWQHRN